MGLVAGNNCLQKKTAFNNTITVAKAIGIICVVVGHSGCPEYIRNLIYLFHMPLFFFISGYCFKDKYLNVFRDFARQRIKGLYLPFIKWTCLFVLLHNLFFCLNLYNPQFGIGNGVLYYNFRDILLHLFYAIFRFDSQEQLLGVFWFINSLFFGYFIFYFCLKFIDKSYFSLLILMILAYLLILFNVKVPYIGFRSIYPAFFITLGYIYKHRIEQSIPSHRMHLLFFLGGGLLIAAFFLKTEILKVSISSFFPYTLFAFIGCLFIINISKFICEYCNRYFTFISYIGNHSFEIMTLHFLSFKLVSLIIINTSNLPSGMLAAFPVLSYGEPNEWWILYSITGIMIPLLYCVFKDNIHNIFKRN